MLLFRFGTKQSGFMKLDTKHGDVTRSFYWNIHPIYFFSEFFLCSIINSTTRIYPFINFLPVKRMQTKLFELNSWKFLLEDKRIVKPENQLHNFLLSLESTLLRYTFSNNIVDISWTVSKPFSAREMIWLSKFFSNKSSPVCALSVMMVLYSWIWHKIYFSAHTSCYP